MGAAVHLPLHNTTPCERAWACETDESLTLALSSSATCREGLPTFEMAGARHGAAQCSFALSLSWSTLPLFSTATVFHRREKSQFDSFFSFYNIISSGEYLHRRGSFIFLFQSERYSATASLAVSGRKVGPQCGWHFGRKVKRQVGREMLSYDASYMFFSS